MSNTTRLLRNPLAETLKSGGLGLAMLLKHARTGDIALAAKTCGLDAVYVDLEHSVVSESDAAQICVSAQLAGITPLVRVPSHDAHHATRMLDAGALGIVVPHVESAEEAAHVVRACKFAPDGERSVAGAWPHLAYESWPPQEARRALNAQSMVIVMLETPEAVERAASIAAVPGVDVLHVGSTDLSEALGIPGQFGHAKMEDAFARVIATCREHGKITGIGGMGSAPDVIRKYVSMGARFVSAGTEWGFMMAGAKQAVALLREGMPRK